MKKLRNTTNGVGTAQSFNSPDFDINGDELSYDLTDEKIALLIEGDMKPNERAELLSFLAKNEEWRRRVSEYVKIKRFEKHHKKNSKEEISSTIATHQQKQHQQNNQQNKYEELEIEGDVVTDSEQSSKVFDNVDWEDDSNRDSFDDEFFGEVPPMLTQKAFDLFNKTKENPKQSSPIYEECEPVYINYSQNEYEIVGIIQTNIETTHLCLELHITKNGQPYKGEVYLYKGKVLYRRLKINKECITCDLSNKGNYHLYIKDDDIIEDKLELDFEVK